MIEYNNSEILTYNADNSGLVGMNTVLVAVRYGEPQLRPGLTNSEEDRYLAAEHYDHPIEALRVFDVDNKVCVDVNKSDLRKFLGANKITNVFIKTTRPFIVTLRNGSPVTTLPVFLADGRVIANDYPYVLFGTEDTDTLIRGDGRWAVVPHHSVINDKQNGFLFCNL